MSTEEKKEIKIERLPTMGRPLSLKGARYKPRLTASDKDLKALQQVIRASEKK